MMVWLERFADHLGILPSRVAEEALSKLASARGFESPPKPVTRPAGKRPSDNISNDLISFINNCEYSLNSVAIQAGIPLASLHRFVRGGGGISLGAAEKIADLIGVKLVPERGNGGGGGGSISTRLKSMIISSGLSYLQLSKLCGINHKTVCRFMGSEDVRLSTAGKFAEVVGMKLIRKGDSKPPDHYRLRDRRKSACCVQLAEWTPDNPNPWTTPPRVLRFVKEPLTEKQYTVVHALVKAGPDGLSGAALRVASGVTGCIRILKMLKASDPGWDFAICFPTQGKSGYRLN